MKRSLIAVVVVTSAILACNFHEVDEAAPNGPGGSTDGAGGSGGMFMGAGGGGAEGAVGTTSAGTGGTPGSPPPGFVACGDMACDSLTDKCCSMTECVPLAGDCSTADISATKPFSEMTCDDDADCPAAETCCVEESAVVAGGLTYACTAGPCQLHPSCTGEGSTCETGFECANDASEITGAKCVSSKASVECGMSTCGADTPVCCVDGNTSSCVGYGECGTGSAFECDEPSDCGMGYVCCASSSGAGSSECAGECKGGTLLCDDDADCIGGPNGTCSGTLGGYSACN